MYQRRDFSLNDTWEALFDRRLGQRVEVMVRIPSNAPVGKEMFRAMFGLLAVLIYLVHGFGCGFSKMVDHKKQDFWPRINILKRKKFKKKSVDEFQFVKNWAWFY